MSSLLDHARQYQNYYNTLNGNALLKKFAVAKDKFKSLIHQYIDAGGSKESLSRLKAKSFDQEGRERIAKKIENFYQKHESNEISGNLDQLAIDIQKSAAVLVKSYEKIDGASFMTPEGITINHRDYRQAKERFVKDLKAVGQAGLAEVKRQLKEAGFEKNILAKVSHMEKKNAKVKRK